MHRSQFSVNLATNILNFGFSIVVGIWLTPYLIRHLGVAAYGMVPLATMLTSYLALFTTAINSAVGRYLTIALDQNNHDEANRIFNTSFWGSAGILALLLAPCIWLALHANWFLDVPTGMESDFAWLLLATLSVFCLTTISSAFTVTFFSLNRFDLSNSVAILNTVTRVAGIVLLFNLCNPRIWHVGVAMLASAACSTAGAVLIWRYLTPLLRIRPSFFHLAALRNMTGTASWIVVNMVGSLLYLSIDLIVVNKIMGPEATGQYGAVMTWATLLRGLGGAVGGIFGPTIIMLHARADTVGLVLYSRRAVKFLGLVLAIPIGLICGMSRPLLELWLGQHFSALAPLMSLMTFHLCVNLAVLPLFNAQVATNRVRIPGIVTCVMGLLNLVLAIVLAGPAGWGMYGVAAAGAIMLTTKNLVFTPLYAARILNVKWNTFFSEIIPVISVTLLLTSLGWLLARATSIHSWGALLGAGIGLSVFAAGFVWIAMLAPAERAQLLRLILPSRLGNAN